VCLRTRKPREEETVDNNARTHRSKAAVKDDEVERERKR
jgi:hypothetical protein